MIYWLYDLYKNYKMCVFFLMRLIELLYDYWCINIEVLKWFIIIGLYYGVSFMLKNVFYIYGFKFVFRKYFL